MVERHHRLVARPASRRSAPYWDLTVHSSASARGQLTVDASQTLRRSRPLDEGLALLRRQPDANFMHQMPVWPGGEPYSLGNGDGQRLKSGISVFFKRFA
jgi:hypothetical protein